MSQRPDLNKIATRLYERALELDSLKFGEFVLSSGQKSSYYFDGRMLSTDPEGADLISRAFSFVIDESDVNAFGGPSVAAVPIVGSLALRFHLERKMKRTIKHTSWLPKRHHDHVPSHTILDTP